MSRVPQNVIKHKVGLLNLAAELGNVPRACKVIGISRNTFYRYRSAMAAIAARRVDALIDTNCKKPNLHNQADEATEAAIKAFFPGPVGLRLVSRLQWAALTRHPRMENESRTAPNAWFSEQSPHKAAKKKRTTPFRPIQASLAKPAKQTVKSRFISSFNSWPDAAT